MTVIDADPAKVGTRWGDTRIRPEAELEKAVRDERVEIAIVAVPANAAQAVADRIVTTGVRGILNFAATPLRVPDSVWVKDVNLVIEMEALSYALTQEAGA